MKIVVFANTAWYVFNFRSNLIRTLLAHGHTVTVLAPVDRYQQRLTALGVSFCPIGLHQTSTNFFREAATMAALLWKLWRMQPDLVLTFTLKCNLYTGLCNRWLRFRHLPTIAGLGEGFTHQSHLSDILGRIGRLALRTAPIIFFQNREDRQFFTDNQLVTAAQSVRIPGSGVDLERFVPVSAWQGVTGPRMFLMYGRLVARKGFDLFLEAARILYTDPATSGRIVFSVMGIVDQGRAESRQLYDKVMEYDRRGWVRCLPAQDDVRDAVQKADVVVLPSQYNEGVPRTLLEALACGKPIITTDWKGCRDTVESGRNGFLVPVNDVVSLCDCIRTLAEMDATELRLMGQASREKAEREFDEKAILRTYLTEVERAE